MKKLHYSITILFIVLLKGSLLAQNIPFEKEYFKLDKEGYKIAINNLEEGDDFFEMGEYYMKDAIPFYEKANKFNPNNDLLNYKLGVCYYYTRKNGEAIVHLNKAKELNPMISQDIDLYLGKSYQRNLEWDNAILAYQSYMASLSPEDVEGIKMAKKYISECNNGKRLSSEPIRVWIDNLGPAINSKHHEYGVAINADATLMMFTSRRPENIGGLIDPSTNDYFEDIYVSEFINDEWTSAENIGEPINDKGHNASIALSNDGMELILFKGNERTLGDLYVTDKYDGEYESARELGRYINSKYHESSASISPDRRKIYFVSDRPEGYGGRDIYVSQWDDRREEFGPAINLGPTINTEYDEEGVFIHPDGKTLYFSSQGHDNMGDYDIFVSTWDGNSWSRPENLGFPVNSPDIDVFFLVSANKRYGYFTSEKEGGYGLRDIYQIEFLGKEKEPVLNTEDNLIAALAKPQSNIIIEPTVEITTSKLALVRGVVLDETTNQPLVAEMELVDNGTGQVLATFDSDAASGRFLVSLPSGKNYGIAVNVDGYLFHSENFLIPEETSYREYELVILMKKIEVGKKIILRNIFFDTNSSVLRPESKTEIARIAEILNDNPNIRVEISGHTDSQGEDKYNQWLSEKRAKSVVDALIESGIDPSRLEFVGYGELDPIESNLTEEGRQENRRTEFKILSKE
jgi:outer membrane protein OmpA-like peptidoglycan-associated protein/tetratricopeptide (TPR) repeat protein